MFAIGLSGSGSGMAVVGVLVEWRSLVLRMGGSQDHSNMRAHIYSLCCCVGFLFGAGRRAGIPHVKLRTNDMTYGLNLNKTSHK